MTGVVGEVIISMVVKLSEVVDVLVKTGVSVVRITSGVVVSGVVMVVVLLVDTVICVVGASY